MVGPGAPSLSALEQVCGAQTDFGGDTQSVYSAYLDAYVAYRHGRLPQQAYCAFQSSIAERHAALAAAGPGARAQWADFFNDARARALSWRAAVDPSLRGG
ncbi:hypothetical protein Busp01_28710 [Trinickia caryophylli]|nr:hypothetical protein Busp01_28710 [Trinickia caryophylli]